MATMAQVITHAQNNPDPNMRSIPTTPTQTGQRPNVSSSDSKACPLCDGLQYIRTNYPVGHPSFGKIVPCPLCYKDEVTAGLNPQERMIKFSNVEINGRPGAAAMLRSATQWIKGGRVGFLAYHGDYGNGKTTMLMAIVNDCIEHQVDVRYITMTEVMVYAREAFESEQRGDTDYGRITQLAATRVLVIDELDKARMSDYAREVQTHLFNIRYRQAHLLGTVMAWNGSFASLDLPWVRSRLSQFTVVENTDTDMRPLLGGMA